MDLCIRYKVHKVRGVISTRATVLNGCSRFSLHFSSVSRCHQYIDYTSSKDSAQVRSQHTTTTRYHRTAGNAINENSGFLRRVRSVSSMPPSPRQYGGVLAHKTTQSFIHSFIHSFMQFVFHHHSAIIHSFFTHSLIHPFKYISPFIFTHSSNPSIQSFSTVLRQSVGSVPAKCSAVLEASRSLCRRRRRHRDDDDDDDDAPRSCALHRARLHTRHHHRCVTT